MCRQSVQTALFEMPLVSFRRWLNLNRPCQVMFFFFFFSWTVNEGLYQEKTTHKLTGEKRESLKTTVKSVARKEVHTTYTHGAFATKKNSQVFFFWVFLYERVSFEPFFKLCVSVGATVLRKQNGAAAKATYFAPIFSRLSAQVSKNALTKTSRVPKEDRIA